LFCRFGFGLPLGVFADAEFAGLRRFLRQLFLHCVAHRDPAALGARNRALDEPEARLHLALETPPLEWARAVDSTPCGVSVATRPTPRCPGIFLFLNVLPGP